MSENPLDSNRALANLDEVQENGRGVRREARAARTGRRTLDDFHRTPKRMDSRRLQDAQRLWRAKRDEILQPPYSFDDLASLMETEPTHYACCQVKAAAATCAGWSLAPSFNLPALYTELLRLTRLGKRAKSQDKKRIAEIQEKLTRLAREKETLRLLFSRPNDEDTWQELHFKLSLDQESLGVCFWEIVRNIRGEPRELYHLPAISMRRLADGCGFVQVRLAGGRGTPAYITPTMNRGGSSHEIVYFKNWGDPRIMDCRNGQFVGVVLPESDANDWIREFRHPPSSGQTEGRSQFLRGADPDDLTLSPPGFVVLWTAGADGIPARIAPEHVATEVFWEKNYSVGQGDGYGLPDVIPSIASVAGKAASRIYNHDFFDNDATPNMIVWMRGVPSGTKDESADAPPGSQDPMVVMQDYLDQNTRGGGNRHKGIVIAVPGDTLDPETQTVVERGGEIKVEKLSDRPEEAGFLGYHEVNTDEILQAERTPPELIATYRKKESVVAGGNSIGLEVFKNFVIGPRQSKRAANVNRIIFEGFGYSSWCFEWGQVDSLDELREMEIATGYSKIDAITINEIRSKLGMEPFPGGDRLVKITPLGLIPVDQLQFLNAEDLAQTPDKPLAPKDQGAPNGRGNQNENKPKPQGNGSSAKNSSVEGELSQTLVKWNVPPLHDLILGVGRVFERKSNGHWQSAAEGVDPDGGNGDRDQTRGPAASGGRNRARKGAVDSA